MAASSTPQAVPLPEHDASAIINEIYAALVIQTTLGDEIRELEQKNAAAATSVPPEPEPFPGVDEVQLVAEEALQMAAHERKLRQSAQTKVRHLLAERNSDATLQEKYDEQRKLVVLKDRQLKDLRTKALGAAERGEAASHGLRTERQKARLQRRYYGAHRTVQLAHELWIVGRLKRALWQWHAKVVDAGIFEVGHAPVSAMRREGASREAESDRRTDDALAHAARAASLESKEAECLALRERLAALEGVVALEGERTIALRRAAERAGQASAALLDARRQNCELAAQLASAHAALERRALETRSPPGVARPAGLASRMQDQEALVETQPLN